MGLLFIAGVGSIIWFTLIVKIDIERQQIRFIYPLRYRTYDYDFASIYGYRYKYLTAKVTYKAIQFRTKDARIFTVSDFETGNLRKVEQLCFENLELRQGKSFNKLNNQQKSREFLNSKQFDIQQAKDIRFYLILGLVLSVFVIGMFLTNPKELNLDLSLFLAFWTVLTIWMAIKLRNVQKIIRDGVQHSV